MVCIANQRHFSIGVKKFRRIYRNSMNSILTYDRGRVLFSFEIDGVPVPSHYVNIFSLQIWLYSLLQATAINLFSGIIISCLKPLSKNSLGKPI